LAKDMSYVQDVIRTGTRRAREVTQETLDEVKSAMGLYKFD
jgi:tryptophanyl-tRNA synthetase